eukprot:6417400-Alexandrium_andersonii.AAC.1
MDAARSARFASLVKRRPQYEGVQHVDIEEICAFNKSLNHEQRVLASRIRMAGVWTQQVTCKFSYSASSACPWCDECEETLQHL